MKRELTHEEVHRIIKEEYQCGVNTLLQELLNCKNPVVTADVDDKGGIGFYEVEEKEIENDN